MDIHCNIKDRIIHMHIQIWLEYILYDMYIGPFGFQNIIIQPGDFIPDLCILQIDPKNHGISKLVVWRS